MSLGERISELRKGKNISQVELSKRLGVSRQAVSKWENDQSSPDTGKLIELAQVLDTEVEYLVTGVKPVYEHPVVVRVVEKVDQVYERVVEKPVIHKVTRVKYLRNPVEFLLFGLLCFALGLVSGWMLWGGI